MSEVNIYCSRCGKLWGTAPNEQMAKDIKIALCQRCAREEDNLK